MPPVYPSRYQFWQAFVASSGDTLQETPVLDRFRFRNREDNLQTRVRTGERLWHIAHRFYPGREDAGSLAWVLAYYNNRPDMTRTIPEGTVIYGPSERVLFEELLAGVA